MGHKLHRAYRTCSNIHKCDSTNASNVSKSSAGITSNNFSVDVLAHSVALSPNVELETLELQAVPPGTTKSKAKNGIVMLLNSCEGL